MSDLNTPDPALTWENAGALTLTVVGDLVVLFGLHITDAQRTAAASLITALYIVAHLAYSAYVRGHRAIAVGMRQSAALPAPLDAPPMPVTTTAAPIPVAPRRVRPSRAKPPGP